MSIKSSLKNMVAQKISFMANIFPRKRNLWVYGAWSGQLYSDNSKYLFEYINQNHPEIRSVWITRNPSVCAQLRENGQEAYLRFSLKGILAALRAEVAFITSSEGMDISPFINRKKTHVIQLWHGVAGKAASWKDSNGVPLFSGSELKRFASYYWMATSAKYIDVMHEVTNSPKENFAITGYPRNDTFITKPFNEKIEQLKKERLGSKLIIYMPTHRNFGKESINVDEFYWLDQKLKDNNIVMVYKPHFHELKNVLHLESEFTNIILAKEQDIWGDVYSYIHYFDLLISDYSSIVYDFLCADKPIVLYTYDLEHYRNEDAGLWDFFEEVPAGPFCDTWQKVMDNVIVQLQNDTWHEKRKICRKMFHPFSDGENSKRVYVAVKEYLTQNNQKRGSHI